MSAAFKGSEAPSEHQGARPRMYSCIMFCIILYCFILHFVYYREGEAYEHASSS